MTRKHLIGRSIESRRLMLAVLLALAVAAAALLWFSDNTRPAPESQAQWVLVQPRLVEQQLGLVGRIQAARQETLSAPFDGVIAEVLVREGQTVAAGQALLRLDPGQIEIRLRQAQAELLRARREVHQLRNWHSSLEVARARRAVQAARAMVQATRTSLGETRALFERGIVARMEVDTLEQQAHTQQQDLLAAEDELHNIEARGEGEERKIAEMELSNAEARYQSVQLQSERRVLEAPFPGVVVRPSLPERGKALVAQAGGQVAQGEPLLAVTGLDRLEVLTRVEEADLRQLTEGMPVQITGDGFAGQLLAGRIASIAVQGNAADAPGAAAHYDVVVSVDAPEPDIARQLRLGMSARLAVMLYRNEQGIVVPAQALATDDDGSQHVLYRATADALPAKMPVTPARAVTEGIEVQGLQAGYVLVPAG